jgi:hypothetical protein
MFANFCIVNRQHYIKSRLNYFKRRVETLEQYCRENNLDDDPQTEGLQLTPDDWGAWGESNLAIVNPFQDIDESGVDLRPLYASALWYLANVDTIVALNALIYDLNKFGQTTWIIRQLQLMENKVANLTSTPSFHVSSAPAFVSLYPALTSTPSLHVSSAPAFVSCRGRELKTREKEVEDTSSAGEDISPHVSSPPKRGVFSSRLRLFISRPHVYAFIACVFSSCYLLLYTI